MVGDEMHAYICVCIFQESVEFAEAERIFLGDSTSHTETEGCVSIAS